MIEVFLEKSREMEESGALVQALEQAQFALQEVGSQGEEITITRIQARIAWLNVKLGNFDSALELSEVILARTQSSPEAVDALIARGASLAGKDDLGQAEGLFQRAADISRFLQYRVGLRWALHSLALLILYPEGKFSLALAAMDEAQQIDNPQGNHNWGLPYVRGLIYQINGDRTRLHQALDDLKQCSKPGSILSGRYYYLWSCLAMDEGDLAKAEEYLRLAIRISTQLGEPNLQVLTRLAFSNLYRLRGESGAALSWADNGLTHANRFQNSSLIGQAKLELAQVEWQLGNLVRVEELLNEADKAFEKNQAAYHLALTHFLLTCLGLEQHTPQVETMWLDAVRRIIHGGYNFILEREHDRAYPLIAHFLRSKNAECRAAAEKLLSILDRLTPAPLKIMGLGQFGLWVGSRQVPDATWNRRKSGELFRYLLLHKGYSASREEVLEDLWGDYDPETAQDLLYQATSTIRRALEPDLPDKFSSRYIRLNGDRVSLIIPPGSIIDFLQFETEIQPAIKAVDRDGLQRVLDSYSGDLFPMDQYSAWSARRRTSLLEKFLLGLLVMAQWLIRDGAFLQASQVIQQILTQDPWNEDAVLLGMQSMVKLGDRPRAVRLYNDLVERLRNDLNLTPKPELVEYLQAIRSGNAI